MLLPKEGLSAVHVEMQDCRSKYYSISDFVITSHRHEIKKCLQTNLDGQLWVIGNSPLYRNGYDALQDRSSQEDKRITGCQQGCVCVRKSLPVRQRASISRFLLASPKRPARFGYETCFFVCCATAGDVNAGKIAESESLAADQCSVQMRPKRDVFTQHTVFSSRSSSNRVF